MSKTPQKQHRPAPSPARTSPRQAAPAPRAAQAAPAPRAVVPAPPRAVVPAPVKNPPPAIYDYGQQAGVGAEDITSADFLLPFVRILQSNSPELNARHEKHVEGATAGELINVSTKRLYPGEEGIAFHLCYKTRAYAEFKPRDAGGGFVGQHDPEDPRVVALRQAQGKFGKLVDAETETELTETYYAYGIIPGADGEDPEPAVLPITSTGMTPFKQFLMVLNPLLRKGVPIYAPRIRVSTKFAQNKDGDFFKWSFRLDGDAVDQYLTAPDDPLMTVCAELRSSVTTGAAKADFTKASSDDPKEPPF